MILCYLLIAGPPKIDVPFMFSAVSDGFCFFGFGGLGAVERIADPDIAQNERMNYINVNIILFILFKCMYLIIYR